MRFKVISLLAVLVLLLATFGTAMAQAEPYCGDLSDSDCEILTLSQAAMMDVSSYQASATYSAMLAGIPGLPANEVSVDVMVDGAFEMDESAMAAAQAMAGLPQEEIMMMISEAPGVLVDLFRGWGFDMVISVEMTPELAAALSMEAGMELPDMLSIPMRLVDGNLYVDLTEVAPLAPGTPEGWIGIPYADLLEEAAAQGAFDDMDSAMSAVDPTTAATLGFQSMLMNPKQFEQFLIVERVDDSGDAGPAVFVTTFDVTSFVMSPDFAELLKQLVASGALGSDGPSEADIDQLLPMLGMMGPMIFQGLNVDSSVAIELEDFYATDYASEFFWDLSGLIQLAAMSGALPEGISAGDEMMVDFSTTVVNSDFNAPQSIEAPADAMMIPLEALMEQ